MRLSKGYYACNHFNFLDLYKAGIPEHFCLFFDGQKYDPKCLSMVGISNNKILEVAKNHVKSFNEMEKECDYLIGKYGKSNLESDFEERPWDEWMNNHIGESLFN